MAAPRAAREAALHGWSFTGGQMWSLVTETRKGVDNRTEALPMTIDAQYRNGQSGGYRFVRRISTDRRPCGLLMGRFLDRRLFGS